MNPLAFIKKRIKLIYDRSPFAARIIRMGMRVRSLLLKPLFYICSKSALCSSIYFIITRQFGREEKAVMHGHYVYLKTHQSPEQNSYLLRRNTHRLEKGMLLKPRRPVFALGYIEETVQLFENLAKAKKQGTSIDEGEFNWARDVLAHYFQIVALDPELTRLKQRFTAAISPEHDPTRIPYVRNPEHKPPIPFDDLLKLMQYRRSVRWFIDKKVPRQIIDNAIVAAGLSPSACNRQPFEFRVVDDQYLVKEVINLPLGTKGYSHNVPVVVVVIGKLNAFARIYDRHLMYIDSSLATMSFILALETQNISSCCINWQDIKQSEKKIATILNLKPYERPIMLIALGYPDPQGRVAYSMKKNIDNLRRYN